jgi:hypothetical protein
MRAKSLSSGHYFYTPRLSVSFRNPAPRQSPDDAFPLLANPDIIGKTGEAAIDP